MLGLDLLGRAGLGLALIWLGLSWLTQRFLRLLRHAA